MTSPKPTPEYSLPILAIDPGVNGGWCVIERSGIRDWGPMPPDPTTGKLMGIASQWYGCTVVIEHQQLAHKLTSGGCKLLVHFGMLQGMFSLNHTVYTLSPKIWQHEYRIQGRGPDRKRNAKAKADEVLRECIPTDDRRKLTLKTCDAFLIADYVARQIRK